MVGHQRDRRAPRTSAPAHGGPFAYALLRLHAHRRARYPRLLRAVHGAQRGVASEVSDCRGDRALTKT